MWVGEKKGLSCRKKTQPTPKPPKNKTTRRRGLRKKTSCKITSVEKLGKRPFRITIAALPGAEEPRGPAPRLMAREKAAGPARAGTHPRRSPPACPGSHAKTEGDGGRATEPRRARGVRQGGHLPAHGHAPPRGPPRTAGVARRAAPLPAPLRGRRPYASALRPRGATTVGRRRRRQGPPRGPLALPPPEVCFPAVLHQSRLCH